MVLWFLFPFSFIPPALHAAALSGHVSTVKLLLEHKAQVDALDVMKHTPLFRACEMGHKEVIQTLIKGQLPGLSKPVQEFCCCFLWGWEINS